MDASSPLVAPKVTILPPRLKYELNPKFNGAPTVQWCGLPVTRLWRCGNRGNVASVLIEKPARGDFLPCDGRGLVALEEPLDGVNRARVHVADLGVLELAGYVAEIL